MVGLGAWPGAERAGRAVGSVRVGEGANRGVVGAGRWDSMAPEPYHLVPH